MESDGSTDKQNLYERPFKPQEHGFVNGNPYILKSALRRRLSQIDPKWRSGEPEIMTVVGDVVLMRGCLIVEGASRCAVGTGIIISTRKDDKTGEIAPLPPYEYARNLAKAYKTAASDLLPRLCQEYNIGAYLKSVPKTVKDPEALAKWLDSLQPRQQQKPPAAEPKWCDKRENLLDLAERACVQLWVENRGDAGVKELETIIAPKSWCDFASGRDAWLSIKATVEQIRASRPIQHFVQPPAEPPADVNPTSTPEPEAAPAVTSLRHYVLVTDATYEPDRDEVIFNTKEDGTLTVKRKALLAQFDSGGILDRPNKERWIAATGMATWDTTDNPFDPSSHTFPELRIDYDVMRNNGTTTLSLFAAAPTGQIPVVAGRAKQPAASSHEMAAGD